MNPGTKIGKSKEKRDLWVKRKPGSDARKKTSAVGVPALLAARDSYWPPHLSQRSSPGHNPPFQRVSRGERMGTKTWETRIP